MTTSGCPGDKYYTDNSGSVIAERGSVVDLRFDAQHFSETAEFQPDLFY